MCLSNHEFINWYVVGSVEVMNHSTKITNTNMTYPWEYQFCPTIPWIPNYTQWEQPMIWCHDILIIILHNGCFYPLYLCFWYSFFFIQIFILSQFSSSHSCSLLASLLFLLFLFTNWTLYYILNFIFFLLLCFFSSSWINVNRRHITTINFFTIISFSTIFLLI